MDEWMGTIIASTEPISNLAKGCHFAFHKRNQRPKVITPLVRNMVQVEYVNLSIGVVGKEKRKSKNRPLMTLARNPVQVKKSLVLEHLIRFQFLSLAKHNESNRKHVFFLFLLSLRSMIQMRNLWILLFFFLKYCGKMLAINCLISEILKISSIVCSFWRNITFNPFKFFKYQHLEWQGLQEDF